MLGLPYLRGQGRSPMLWPGVLHGLTGAIGTGLLVLATRGPAAGTAKGAGSFGIAAVVLFALALVFGPLIRLSPRRVGGVVLAVHASLAITGLVLCLAWRSVG